jgi:hypothetical protein
MPTQPLETILYRELAIIKAQEIIELGSPLLREIVNYSTNALIRCATTLTGFQNEDVAVMALYRHILEMSDGIEVLVSQSCAIPAIPLVRSSFEALLSLEYILENKTYYTDRSLAWLLCYVHTRIKFYESLNISTKLGKTFLESLRQDKTINLNFITLPPQVESEKAIINLQNLLLRPQFQSIEEEYSRYKKTPNWFSLFKGPNTIRDLAHHNKRDAQYDFLYRIWSTTTHAQDFSTFTDVLSRNQSGIRSLRDSSQLKDVITFSTTFLLNATRIVLHKFRPEENITNWYLTEVRDRYFNVMKVSKF